MLASCGTYWLDVFSLDQWSENVRNTGGYELLAATNIISSDSIRRAPVRRATSPPGGWLQYGKETCKLLLCNKVIRDHYVESTK